MLTFVWQSEPDEPDPELEPEPDELSEELRARRVFLLEGLLFLALEALEPLEGLELTSSTEEKDER